MNVSLRNDLGLTERILRRLDKLEADREKDRREIARLSALVRPGRIIKGKPDPVFATTPERVTMRGIVDRIAAEEGIPPALIYGPSKRRGIVAIRKRAMVDAKAAGMSVSEIARALNRDHTTVRHGLGLRSTPEQQPEGER